MKEKRSIYLYGAVIILAGISLLASAYSTFSMVRLTVGISLTAGAILAFISAYARQRKQVQFAYHGMHALAMLVYGVSVLVFCNTPDKLMSVTAFLLIFYAFSETILCYWLFDLGQKVFYKIMIIRFLLGLAIGAGTIVAMNFTAFTLEGFGLLFVMVGINIILYVPVMKTEELN
jgi:hypothetical protein